MTNMNGHHDDTTVRPHIDSTQSGDRVEWARPLRVEREVARILDRALDGEDITVDEAVALFGVRRARADGDSSRRPTNCGGAPSATS